MFIVKFKRRRRTIRRFHVQDPELARALVQAGLQLGWSILLQTPDGRLFAG